MSLSWSAPDCDDIACATLPVVTNSIITYEPSRLIVCDDTVTESIVSHPLVSLQPVAAASLLFSKDVISAEFISSEGGNTMSNATLNLRSDDGLLDCCEGRVDGKKLGCNDGEFECSRDGKELGCDDGEFDGPDDGSLDGKELGCDDGEFDGTFEGCVVGEKLG